MVQISVTDESTGKVVRVDVAEDTTVEVLKAIVEVDFDIPASEQVLSLDGNELGESSRTMNDAGVKEDSMVVLARRAAQPQPTSQPTRAGVNDPDALTRQLAALLGASLSRAGGGPTSGDSGRPAGNTANSTPPVDEMYRKQAEELLTVSREDPGFLGVLSIQNPPLGEVLRSAAQGGGNIESVITVVKEQHERRLKTEQERNQKMAAVMADPLSMEAQAFLEDQIQQQHVDQNYELAQEHLPEAFGTVFMLYVDVEVNGVPIKAFVDSGAQSTIMSGKCAERCNLLRLVDKRFQGIAQGVGTSKIIGRIHMAQIKIGQQFFPASFTVLEDDKVDFLFGLDMLKRYQCCIDLQNDVLRIGGQSVPFLSEKDLSHGLFGRLNSGLSPSQRTTSVGAEATAKAVSSAEGTSADSGKPKEHSDNDATNSASEAVSSSPATAPDAPRPPTDGGGGRDPSVDESKVKQLVDLGFDRNQAIMALQQTGGDAELAGSLLFQQSSLL